VDAGDNSSNVVRPAAIPSILSGTPPERIYNMDETGLMFRQLPRKSVQVTAEGVPTSGKAANDRVTVVMCCNADGSHKIDLTIIGKHQTHKCFTNWLPSACNVQYLSNNNAWQTGETFREWLQHFSSSVSERHGPGQVVWLTMYNSSAHCIPNDAEQKLWSERVHGFAWRNLNVVFLTPNITSHAQPLDQGIMVAYKAGYRRRHCAYLLACCETELEKRSAGGAESVCVCADSFTVDMRQVIEWSVGAWKDVAVDTIRFCWQRSRVLPGNEDAVHQANDASSSRIFSTNFPEVTENTDVVTKTLDRLRIFLIGDAAAPPPANDAQASSSSSSSLGANAAAGSREPSMLVMTAQEFLAVDYTCPTKPSLDLDSLVEYANSEQAGVLRKKTHNVESENAEVEDRGEGEPAVRGVTLWHARVSCEGLKRFVSNNMPALRSLNVSPDVCDALNILSDALMRMENAGDSVMAD
jgi:hypothetical protein